MSSRPVSSSAESVRIPVLFLLIFFATLNVFLLYKRALGLDNSTHVMYYAQLAWSFLHHRLDVAAATLTDVDLSPYHGRIYAYWPPLTALLMTPMVALRGLYN